MLDFQSQIERLFNDWSWIRLCWAGLLCLVLLGGAELIVRKYPTSPPLTISATKSFPYVVRWHDRNNPDPFSRVVLERSPNDTYVVAWIGASATRVWESAPDCKLGDLSKYTLSYALSKKLRSVDGKPVRVEEYFQAGMGIFDLRRAIFNAIEDPDTDMIVVELNPLVIFNDLRVLGHSRQRASILFQKPARLYDLWLVLPALRPSEFVLTALGQVSELVRQRGTSPLIVEPNVLLASFPNFPKADSEKERSELKTTLGHLLLLYGKQGPKYNKQQKEFLALYTSSYLDEGSAAAEVLANTFSDLRASGKKVFAYLTPINSSYRDNSEIISWVDKMREKLSLADGPDSPNVIVDKSSILSDIGRLDFRDYVHLNCPIGLVDVVSNSLLELNGGRVEMNADDAIFGAGSVK